MKKDSNSSLQPKKIQRAMLYIPVILLGLFIALYILFVIPLPFNSAMWQSHTARHRMTDSLSERVIGLSADEIVTLLGNPSYDRSYAVSHREMGWSLGRYRLVSPEFFTVYFDENGFVAFGHKTWH